MIAPLDAHASRPVLTFSLELSHGRPGASARVEVHDAAPGGRAQARIARVALAGCIDAVAARRLGEALDDLALRGVEDVLVDCEELRHVDFRLVPELVATLERFEARSGGVVMCGLSRYLRDVFRLAGCEARLRCWPSSSELLESSMLAPEPGRERAS
ncbi:MAG: STAS domain-containing protein [Candidatus Eisenbacteria bacterium]|uniref:STAS domain-containing protein n=1 Tax=Eiseniibacteriota bacterium TaxID=2212470 RepID=A0A9D6QID0_UNCEI|nr:STAS domain-containing protein [Candidatus Eisenbacteria bacterium]MBI3539197.1 STAS domain-containing protein [Candidatus Eisenbacteria bacterium]